MKPPLGTYKINWTDASVSPPVIREVTYKVEADMIPEPWGNMMWEAAGDCFRRGAYSIECTGSGTGLATMPDPAHPGQVIVVTLTCVKIA